MAETVNPVAGEGAPKMPRLLTFIRCESGFVLAESQADYERVIRARMWAFDTIEGVATFLASRYADEDDI
jgi:hypothetical protein